MYILNGLNTILYKQLSTHVLKKYLHIVYFIFYTLPVLNTVTKRLSIFGVYTCMNPMDAIYELNLYQCSGGTARPDPECGYRGCQCLLQCQVDPTLTVCCTCDAVWY